MSFISHHKTKHLCSDVRKNNIIAPDEGLMTRLKVKAYRSKQIVDSADNGERCQNQAGNASYSKRIQKTVQQRKLKLVRDDSVSHIYICDYHKNIIQRVRTKRRRKECVDGRGSPDADEEYPEIDFLQIPVNTLRRYKRHFKISNRPGLNKSQLAEVVAKHFHTLPVNEKETTTYFFYMAKNYKNRLDQKQSEGGPS